MLHSFYIIKYHNWTCGIVMGEETQVDVRQQGKERSGQRRFFTAFLVAAILLLSIGGLSYFAFQQAYTTVVYEVSDVPLTLGVDYLYGEFRGIDPPDNLILGLGIKGDIAEGNGGSVRYNFDYRKMTLAEYLQLNETEHELMLSSSETSEYGLFGSAFGGGGLGGPINDDTYVWFLRFLEVGEKTTGNITISFQIYICPFPV
jgi:hypothetical protein